MKQYTTNYINAFIEVADDCPVNAAEAPPAKEPRTAAQIEYELIACSPYRYGSDDVLYESNGRRRGLSREEFFSKGQPCMRSSALAKRYGWGVHFDNGGNIALYAVESDGYKRLAADESLKHIKAMRSKKQT